MLCAPPLYAARWCAWSGTEGTNCQSDTRRYLLALDGHKISVDEANLNAFGFYELTTTQPTIGADQVKDSEVWGLVGNQMSLTWSVRDMTATEIDNRIASPMSMTDYYIWKALLVTGVLTQAQATANLPAEMIDAYKARARLLGD